MGRHPIELNMEVSELGQRKPVYTKTRLGSPARHLLDQYGLAALLDNPAARDCYNLLRIQIVERTLGKGHNAIMVTSSVNGEGKTVTAINLAASIAREAEQTVLLVDVNLRDPRIDRYLGMPAEKGLSDYLLENEPLENLLVSPGIDRLTILPAGQRRSDSTRILGSPRMTDLIGELKNRYRDRYVIFDSPPLLTIPDSVALSSLVDGVVLVVETGKTPKDSIRKALELLQGRRVIGFVLNRMSRDGKGSGES